MIPIVNPQEPFHFMTSTGPQGKPPNLLDIFPCFRGCTPTYTTLCGETDPQTAILTKHASASQGFSAEMPCVEGVVDYQEIPVPTVWVVSLPNCVLGAQHESYG